MFSATNVETFESISVRCATEAIEEIRTKHPAVTKHKYFSEKNWNLISMDGSISDKLIIKWINDSYNLAILKLTKKVRSELSL